MNKLLGLAFLLTMLASPALAANCAAFSYNLVNGTPADANQVMSNFNTLMNCSNTNLLAVSSNLGDVASAAASRANLGVTATGADTAYAFRANNLSDLANAATARTNLGLGTAAVINTGTSGGTLCLLNASCSWTGQESFTLNYPTTNYPIIAATNGDGIVSPRTQTMLQIVCSPNLMVSPECNVVDAFAYNGYVQYNCERYDRGGPNNGAVLNGEGVCVFAVDPYDGTSDATTAGISSFTTEDQVHDTHHGTSLHLAYTPNNNGASKRCAGLWISEGGIGGVSVGDAGLGIGNNTGSCSGVGPTALGNGTIRALSDIDTDNHFRSTGGAPTPSVCATATVSGTDVAGSVSTGGSCSDVKLTFVHPYPTTPICFAQNYANSSPVAFPDQIGTDSFHIKTASPVNGTLLYLCVGQP